MRPASRAPALASLILVAVAAALTSPLADLVEDSPDAFAQAAGGHLVPAGFGDGSGPHAGGLRGPPRFEPNLGQWPEEVRFVARGGDRDAVLLEDGLRLVTDEGPVELRWDAFSPVALATLESVSHYYMGNDPQRWSTNVPHAARVAYDSGRGQGGPWDAGGAGAKPQAGLQVHVRWEGQSLEFDQVLAPHASPQLLRFRVVGATPHVQDDGSLRLGVGHDAAVLAAPVAFQESQGGRDPVASWFEVAGHEVRLGVGGYDPARPLVVDPVVRYSSFVGVFQRDQAYAVKAFEPPGSPGVRRVFVGGSSDGINPGSGIVYPAPFSAPTNATRHGTSSSTSTEAWVARFDYTIPTRQMVPVWFAYFGGSCCEAVEELAVNALGELAVSGTTSATAFPTMNAVQYAGPPAYDGSIYQGGNGDAFLMKFSATGTLQFSTFLGGAGTDNGEGLAWLPDGTLAIAGETRITTAGAQDFPTTVGSYQPVPPSAIGGNIGDAYVARINPATTPASLVFSTFLAGGGSDRIEDLAVDPTGIYVVGATGMLGSNSANNFPTTPGAYQTAFSPSGDAFVAKLSLDGSSLLRSTLLGGTMSEVAQEIDLDPAGRVWFSMFTQSPNLPVCSASPSPCVAGSPPPFQSSFQGFVDVWFGRLEANFAGLSYGSYLGGGDDDRANDLDFEPATDRVAIVGHTGSSNFPAQATAPFPVRRSGGTQPDGYVFQMGATNGTVGMVTFFASGNATVPANDDLDTAHGVALDDEWGTFVVGLTYNAAGNFPITHNRVQPAFGGIQDAYLGLIGKRGPTAVLRAQATGFPTVTVAPYAGVYAVPAGTNVQLDILLSTAGDFAVVPASTTWAFFDGHVVLSPLPSPPPGSTATWSRGPGTLGTACATVWDADPVGTFDRNDTKCLKIQWLNNPPVARNETVVVVEDGGAQGVDVLANDTDPDGFPLAITAASAWRLLPSQGSFAWNASALAFTPAANAYTLPPPGPPQPIWINYTVTDVHGASRNATATIHILEVNDPPTANDDAASTPEDTAVSIAVLANDLYAPDPPEVLSVAAYGPPTAGSVLDLGGGMLQFNPPPGASGTYTFPYTASDGRGGTDLATVTITVLPVNDVPVANDDSATLVEDTPTDVAVLSNDVDADGDTLAIVSVTPAAHGVLQVVGQLLRYAPDPDWSGTDAFTYTISDGNGGTATAAVAITVVEANDPPVAVDDVLVVAEDSANNVVPVLANDHMGPDVGETLSVVSVGPAMHGTAVLAAGVVAYTPAVDYFGPDAFTYTLSDGRGGTAVGNVAVTVLIENVLPVGGADVLVALAGVDGQCFGVLGNDVDLDGPQPLRVASLQAGPDAVPADVRVAAAHDGVCTDGQAAARFRYVLTDGDRSVEVPIEVRLGLPPTPLVALESQADVVCVAEPAPMRAFAGWDGHTLQAWTWTWPGGTLTVPSAGLQTTPALVFPTAGPATVTVGAHFAPDGGGAEVVRTADVSVVVAGCRPPVVACHAVAEGFTVRFSQQTFDPDGTAFVLSWSFGDGMTSGEAQPTHAYGAAGAYRVVLTATDPDGKQGRCERTLVLGFGGGGGAQAAAQPPEGSAAPDSVNKPPVAWASATSVAPAGTRIVLDAAGTFDPDGDVLAYTWAQVAGAPVALVDADAPQAGFTMPEGAVTFRLTVSDGRAWSSADVRVEPPLAALPPPPVSAASFAVTVDGLGVRVEDRSATGPGARHTWHFGDGSSGSGAAANHAYLLPGTYYVTLYVDQDGVRREATQAVHVEGAPVRSHPAGLEAPPAAPAVGGSGAWVLVILGSAALVAGAALAVALWRRR